MKYKLFRSPGNLDKAVRKHELVAVETGKSIDDVANALIRAVRDDLAEMPERFMESGNTANITTKKLISNKVLTKKIDTLETE